MKDVGELADLTYQQCNIYSGVTSIFQILFDNKGVAPIRLCYIRPHNGGGVDDTTMTPTLSNISFSAQRYHPWPFHLQPLFVPLIL